MININLVKIFDKIKKNLKINNLKIYEINYNNGGLKILLLYVVKY